LLRLTAHRRVQLSPAQGGISATPDFAQLTGSVCKT